MIVKKCKSVFSLSIRFLKTLFQKTKYKLNKFEKSNLFKCCSNYLQFVINLLTLLTIIIALLTFYNISNLSDLKYHIKTEKNSYVAVVEWKKEFNNIRIGYSRDYVESQIGRPQILENVYLDSATFIKTTYLNSYFSLFCVYEEDSSLLGYLIIGNDKRFNLSNYRCNFCLFDYSMNGAEEFCFKNGIGSVMFFRNHSGFRLDTNDYCFECNFQHSEGAVEPCLIGYGICDIGYLDSRADFYKAAEDMHIAEGGFDNRIELYDESKNDSIRDLPINSFLIMAYSDESIDLLYSDLIPNTHLGMSRSAYANYQQDYKDTIDSFGFCFDSTEER